MVLGNWMRRECVYEVKCVGCVLLSLLTVDLFQLKGKSDAADYEAESSDRSAAPGPGYTDHEVVTSPLQNPVSSKILSKTSQDH
ncbi:hypothetical protein GBA52_020592 [Prunus armeniaca]|nr:hypothetical protein GBA52_020592 [Prunus armeniaca]